MDISKKKPTYPIKQELRDYLKKYSREEELPVKYTDLLHYSGGIPLYDKNGNDTFWESVIYPPYLQEELNIGLTTIYALLRTDGEMSVIEHLSVNRIDYCHFGNSKPFRIRIINRFNDNYDYFYIKTADASRVYGLELEHILSPNRINYLVDGDSLIEEHIAGIPGDAFIENYVTLPNFNKVRLAKEFVKFNERCFTRLLGDMRSYNYVIDVTPDFEEEQYRVRAIDFDQQCFEGRLRMYKPQFFKENNAIVQFCVELLNPETVKQYQHEERIIIKRRYEASETKIKALLRSMKHHELSTSEKKEILRFELNEYHQTKTFTKLKSIGEIMQRHLKLMLTKPKPKKLSGKATFKLK